MDNVPIVLGHLKNVTKEDRTGTVAAHTFLPMHGLMQKGIAKRDCFEYFQAVDNIIIRVEFDKFPELLQVNGVKWVNR